MRKVSKLIPKYKMLTPVFLNCANKFAVGWFEHLPRIKRLCMCLTKYIVTVMKTPTKKIFKATVTAVILVG